MYQVCNTYLLKVDNLISKLRITIQLPLLQTEIRQAVTEKASQHKALQGEEWLTLSDEKKSKRFFVNITYFND